jgi:type 1 glutamine amidotransferase
MGLADFVIHDETYGNTYVSPSVHVLLRAENPKNIGPFAWTNHYGKSRIVYFQAGHDAEAWKNSNFQEILGRSIRWVARSW